MSTRLSRGRSTPAIRATLSLPLLVSRVRADHHDPPTAPDDLALLAHLLDGRPYLHLFAPRGATHRTLRTEGSRVNAPGRTGGQKGSIGHLRASVHAVTTAPM